MSDDGNNVQGEECRFEIGDQLYPQWQGGGLGHDIVPYDFVLEGGPWMDGLVSNHSCLWGSPPIG